MGADGALLAEPGQGLRLAQAAPKAVATTAKTGSAGGYSAWTYAGLVLGAAAIATPLIVLETTSSDDSKKAVSPK